MKWQHEARSLPGDIASCIENNNSAGIWVADQDLAIWQLLH